MLLESIAIALGLVAIVLYAVLSGADFGGGVWDLLASGPRAIQQREAIGEAMGPVWETNHVWLIFLLVLLWTCFPPVFAVLGTKLFVPLTLALLGIVLRGAAFAFRGPPVRQLLPHKVWGVVFGIASLITPFFYGASVAGIATGSFDWRDPMSTAVGVFAIALCAQLAAVYLMAETRGELRLDFARRAGWSTFFVAFTGLVALGVAYMRHTRLIAHLLAPAPLAVIALAMLLGLVLLALIRTDHALWARITVGAEVTAVLCGWYAAQAPYALHDLGVTQPAAPAETLVAFIATCIVGGIVLIPSLILLFSIFKRTPIT